MSESNYRNTPYGEEMRCPECGEWTHCDYVDNGVGMEKCGPYGCERCGWIEDIDAPLESLSAFFKS